MSKRKLWVNEQLSYITEEHNRQQPDQHKHGRLDGGRQGHGRPARQPVLHRARSLRSQVPSHDWRGLRISLLLGRKCGRRTGKHFASKKQKNLNQTLVCMQKISNEQVNIALKKQKKHSFNHSNTRVCKKIQVNRFYQKTSFKHSEHFFVQRHYKWTGQHFALEHIHTKFKSYFFDRLLPANSRSFASQLLSLCPPALPSTWPGNESGSSARRASTGVTPRHSSSKLSLYRLQKEQL